MHYKYRDDGDERLRQQLRQLKASIDGAYGTWHRSKELEQQALALLMEAEACLRRIRPSPPLHANDTF